MPGVLRMRNTMNVNDTIKTGIAEMIILFHGLTGLCAGWIWGARLGILSETAASLTGCILGLITGFLVSRLSRSVRLVNADIRTKYRVVAALVAFSGVATGIAFWSACFNCVHG